ncbi:MAG: HEAT repeat domain-containing protein [Nitrospirae bacterium]|nr:HEAT repeat domain-containing protein [Nitrospirota bacterium]
MEQGKKETNDLKTMIADYMEGGYLDNIIDMFKHDPSLYVFVGELLTDERMRVRIGTAALIETLKSEDPVNVKKAINSLIPLLENESPVVRGDVAYVLGIIGDKDTMHLLEKLKEDEDENVKTIAQESIDEIKKI